MRRTTCVVAALLAVLFLVAAEASATSISTWAMNLDGDTYLWEFGDPTVALPSSVDASLFDLYGTGLGVITINFNAGAGSHAVAVGLDEEIGDLFDDEVATGQNVLATGETASADDPGYNGGSLIARVLAGAPLDNLNYVWSGDNDVAVGFGWNFVLGANQSARIKMWAATSAPTSGVFFIEQFDNQTQSSLYFWGGATVVDNGTIDPGAVPEPLTMTATLMALGGLSVYIRRRRAA